MAEYLIWCIQETTSLIRFRRPRRARFAAARIYER